jgi:hypothetical protein
MLKLMNTFRVKVLAWYHKIKSSKRVSIVAIALLVAAIPTTVFLAEKVADIRQRAADTALATITVNPTTAKAGDWIIVSWNYQNGVAVTATPIPSTAPTAIPSTTQPTPTTQQDNPTATPIQSTTLPTVQNLTAKQNGSYCNQVVLTWDPPSGVTGSYTYSLVRTVQGYPDANKTIENITAPYYTDTGLPYGSGSQTTVTYQVRVRQGTNQSAFSNTAQVTLVCPTALQFPQLIQTAYAQGGQSTAQADATGNYITASPNPCTLGADGLCSAKIILTVPNNPPNLQIKIREIGAAFTGVGADPKGTFTAPWITATGYTFDLYEGNTLMGSVFVNGVKGITPTTATGVTQDQSVTASPTPIQATPSPTGAETLQLINLDGGIQGPQMYLNCLQASSGNQPPVAAPATGSCSYPLVATLPKGSYVMRMLAADGVTILGQSATISVESIPYIFASPNPCALTAQGLCSSTITWTGNGANEVNIRLKENPNASFANGAYGSKEAPWITATGYTFELYSGNTLLTSVFVKGIPENKLVATPNPCALDTQGLCSSTIAWSATSYQNVSVKVNGLLFAQGPAGISQAPWIPRDGAKFELYSGTTLIDSLTVYGVDSTDPRAPTPTPTLRPTTVPTQTPVPTTIPATTAPVPTATPAADNSQNNYQYLYDPNN